MWIVIALLAAADLLTIFACMAALSGKISRLEEETLIEKLGNSTISEEAFSELVEP